MSAVFGEKTMRAINALPRKISEAKEDDLLKEAPAMRPGSVVATTPRAGYGGEACEAIRFDRNSRVRTGFSVDRWGLGWHQRAAPPYFSYIWGG